MTFARKAALMIAGIVLGILMVMVYQSPQESTYYIAYEWRDEQGTHKSACTTQAKGMTYDALKAVESELVEQHSNAVLITGWEVMD